jgi:hypothetical protein
MNRGGRAPHEHCTGEQMLKMALRREQPLPVRKVR